MGITMLSWPQMVIYITTVTSLFKDLFKDRFRLQGCVMYRKCIDIAILSIAISVSQRMSFNALMIFYLKKLFKQSSVVCLNNKVLV